MFSSPREASTGLEARFTLLCFHYRNVPHIAMAAKTTPLGSAMHMDVHFKIPMKLPINPTHGVLVLAIKTCPTWSNHTEWQLQLNLLLLMSVIMNNNIDLYVFLALSSIFFIILYTCIVKYYLNDNILQRVEWDLTERSPHVRVTWWTCWTVHCSHVWLCYQVVYSVSSLAGNTTRGGDM